MGLLYQEDFHGNLVKLPSVSPEKLQENSEIVKNLLHQAPDLLAEVRGTRVRDYHGYLRLVFFGKLNFSVNSVDWSIIEAFIKTGVKNE